MGNALTGDNIREFWIVSITFLLPSVINLEGINVESPGNICWMRYVTNFNIKVERIVMHAKGGSCNSNDIQK